MLQDVEDLEKINVSVLNAGKVKENKE